LFFISCSRHGIVKTYAFVRQTVAGTIKVDDSGRPMSSGITTQHLIFVETDTSRGSLQWGTAWIDQKPYTVQPIEITDHDQILGKTMDGENVTIDVKKKHRLWQLVLSPAEDSIGNADLREKIKKSKILLTGTWKAKPFSYKISKEKQLQRLELQ
jgi:hypothetical protein